NGGPGKPDKDNYLALEKERSTLTFEEYKLRAEKEAETQKNIYENELNSYEMRLEALKHFNAMMSQIKLNDIEVQIGNQQLTIDKLTLGDKESNADFAARKVNEHEKLNILQLKFNAQKITNLK